MTPELSTASIYTDFAGLTQLKAQANQDDPQALRAVARQFEALFLQMVLKSMRDASIGDSLFDNDQSRLYRDLFDKQLTTSLADGGLGLADAIVRQLGAAPATASDAPPPAIARAADAVVPAPEPAAVDAAELDGTPEGFVQALWPHAERAGRALGVAPQVLIAQSALETGWGRAVIRHPDGRSSHNLFGIKAGSAWDGEQVSVDSLEYTGATVEKQRSAFRSYSSFAESFSDYVEFLRANPRYAGALQRTHSPGAFVQALQDAGYATDPAYARKIEDIMSSARLGGAVAAVKTEHERSIT